MSFFDFFKKKTPLPPDAPTAEGKIPDLKEATPDEDPPFIDAAEIADIKERRETTKSKGATVVECEPSTDASRIQEQQYEERDPLFMDAVDTVMETEMASVSMLQRKLKLGYSRAAHLMNQMEAMELVGPFEGAKPRKVLVSKERWEEMRPQMARTCEDNSAQNSPPVASESPPSALLDFDSMDGLAFEKYCGTLLTLNGYDKVVVTQGSGDQGIDILAERDGVKYAIQCKRYEGNVGNAAVQEAIAGKNFYDCHVAVVLTNQHFTASAQQLAQKTGVLLWGRETLKRLAQTTPVK